jgi:hypothetical protein
VESVGVVVMLHEDLRPLVREWERGDLRANIRQHGRDGLVGDRLRALDGVAEVVRAWAEAVGVPAVPGQSFRCILPGHDDCIAELWWPDDRGIAVYQCSLRHAGRETFTLTEVWAATRLEFTGQMTRSVHPRLKRLMLSRVGLLDLKAIDLPLPPGPVSEDELRAHEGTREWLAVRELADKPDEGVPLVAQFMAQICRVDAATYKEYRGRMRRARCLVEVGKDGNKKLWRPGPGEADVPTLI